MTQYLFTPPAGATGSAYGIYSDSGATSLAAIYSRDSLTAVNPILESGDRTGALPSFRGPVGVQTLYMRQLAAGVTPIGSITALTGVDLTTGVGGGVLPAGHFGIQVDANGVPYIDTSGA